MWKIKPRLYNGLAYWLVGCVTLGGCSSVPLQKPSDRKFAPLLTHPQIPIKESSAASISNLRPIDGTVLFYGRSYPVAVDVSLAQSGPGSVNYIVEWSFANDRMGPFELSTISSGETSANVSVTLNWLVPVRKTHEQIQISLYRVVYSNTGKTAIKTLVESIDRSYDVRCDPDDGFVARFLRKLFCACQN